MVTDKAEDQAPTVLQVLPALESGGVERGTIDVARGLRRAGWNAAVASAGGPMVVDLERIGARHIRLPLSSKNPWLILRNALRLSNLVKKYQIDVIHARSRAPAWSAWMAARMTGRPFVTTFHGPYSDNAWKHRYNAIMEKGDRVIATSHFIADYVRAHYTVPPERMVIIHRGVDMHYFDPANISAERQARIIRDWRLPEDKRVVLMPGRLTRWKGQSVLIEALALLQRDDLICVLVGSDQGRSSYREELTRLAEKLGVAAMLRMPDHCADMPAGYMLSDVVISASTEPEGFGRISVEAQAMGRPVIATDHGGARETVVPQTTGWLLPPRDPQALAVTIEEALSLDPATRLAVAEAARENVRDKFSLEQMCRETIRVYESVMDVTRLGALRNVANLREGIR